MSFDVEVGVEQGFATNYCPLVIAVTLCRFQKNDAFAPLSQTDHIR